MNYKIYLPVEIFFLACDFQFGESATTFTNGCNNQKTKLLRINNNSTKYDELKRDKNVPPALPSVGPEHMHLTLWSEENIYFTVISWYERNNQI